MPRVGSSNACLCCPPLGPLRTPAHTCPLIPVPTSGTFRVRLLSGTLRSTDTSVQGKGRAGPPGPEQAALQRPTGPWCLPASLVPGAPAACGPPAWSASLPGHPLLGPLTIVLFPLSLLLRLVPTAEEAQEEASPPPAEVPEVHEEGTRTQDFWAPCGARGWLRHSGPGRGRQGASQPRGPHMWPPCNPLTTANA